MTRVYDIKLSQQSFFGPISAFASISNSEIQVQLFSYYSHCCNSQRHLVNTSNRGTSDHSVSTLTVTNILSVLDHIIIMNSGELATCPFCGYTSSDTYTLIHHVEVLHPENGQSPFAAVDDDCPNGANKPTINNGEPVPESNAEVSLSAEDAVAEDMYYLDCPVGCGEKILPDDLSLHLDLHFAESAAFEEVGLTDLAKEHVNKGHGDYVTDAGLEVAKKMAEDFSAYEGDFTVAGKGSRKHHRRRHSESSRSSKKSTSSQSSGKFSV